MHYWNIPCYRPWFQISLDLGIDIRDRSIWSCLFHSFVVPQMTRKVDHSDESFHVLHRHSRDRFQPCLDLIHDKLHHSVRCSSYSPLVCHSRELFKLRKNMVEKRTYDEKMLKVENTNKILIAIDILPRSFYASWMTESNGSEASAMNSKSTISASMEKVIWM